MRRTTLLGLRPSALHLLLVFCLFAPLLLSRHADASDSEVRLPGGGNDAATAPASANDDTQSLKPHLLAGSYYSVKDGLSATLMLNNKGPHPLEVTPTLFDLAGHRLEIASITVEPNSFRNIDLREWAALGGESFQAGSIQLFHRGRDLVLGAQIYLVDAEHSLSFEEKLIEIGTFGSARLEGLWWMPSRETEVSLVLSNASGDPLSVRASLAGAKHRQGGPHVFDLAPHETRVRTCAVSSLSLTTTPGSRRRRSRWSTPGRRARCWPARWCRTPAGVTLFRSNSLTL
jgi:hypothetical protein